MILVITIISIFVLAGAVWLLNKILSIRICPICAGVSGTWIWILVGIYFGMLDIGSWQLVVAIAMGGSVVGVAYQVEKKLPAGLAGWRTPLLWKMLFIPAGFVFVYGVLVQWWNIVFSSFAFLLFILFIFLQRKIKGNNKAVAAPPLRGEPRPMGREELEKKMESCC